MESARQQNLLLLQKKDLFDTNGELATIIDDYVTGKKPYTDIPYTTNNILDIPSNFNQQFFKIAFSNRGLNNNKKVLKVRGNNKINLITILVWLFQILNKPVNYSRSTIFNSFFADQVGRDSIGIIMTITDGDKIISSTKNTE